VRNDAKEWALEGVESTRLGTLDNKARAIFAARVLRSFRLAWRVQPSDIAW